MIILALESSARCASAAICRDETFMHETIGAERDFMHQTIGAQRDLRLIALYFQNSGLTHSRTLLPMAEDMLKNAELTMADIDLVAVAHGPGSFTGIRIGVAAALGLAWGADKPAVGVSTLSAMSWLARSADPGAIVCPVMDARRDEVYNALFGIRDGSPVRLCGDRAISLPELAEELRKIGKTCCLLGDGTEITRRYFDVNGVPCYTLPEPMQNAWGVAQAAAVEGVSPLRPVYLRPSQAERERKDR